MAEIGRWNGYVFEVSPSVIRGFTGLKIKGSSETEEKKSSKQKYVKRKNAKPKEISLTVRLVTALGCNVRDEAMDLVGTACAGKSDYFYIGSKKLMTCKVMLVDAQVQEVTLAPNATWIAADVALTFKQSSKDGGSTSSSKKKSKKKSTKKSSTKSKKTSTSSKKNTGSKKDTGVDAVSGAAPSVSKAKAKVAQTTKKIVSAATSAIKKLTTAAKKLTASKKTTVKKTTAKKTVYRKVK